MAQEAAKLLVKQYEGRHGKPGLDTLNRRVRGADKSFLKWMAQLINKDEVPQQSIF